MIRFLDLNNQITEVTKHFAFYDTVTDTVCSFNGQQVFDSIGDFKYNFVRTSESGKIDRYLKLIPENYFTKSHEIEWEGQKDLDELIIELVNLLNQNFKYISIKINESGSETTNFHGGHEYEFSEAKLIIT